MILLRPSKSERGRKLSDVALLVPLIGNYKCLYFNEYVAQGRGTPPGDEDLTKTVDATGESSVCSLVHRDKKSDNQVQRNYRTQYGREPTSPLAIRAWYTSFKETSTVWNRTAVPTSLSGLVYVIYGNKHSMEGNHRPH
ncbi:hypothetical protein AVEN_253288-1 [Araneus ventricosus]|uniref:DUF4817 domain-containing protein n=1 Tax=Araneus ventricosus TaxID=182803 RepID=A0A4Y2KRD6_ARAVE|nr:hypothetical protein AVEN_253288-1 [Araneus ventricosus]